MRTLTEREYNKIHQWNLRHWTKTGICEHCKLDKKTEWSNKTGQYIRYDKTDWQELCSKCHFKYDSEVLGRKPPRESLTPKQRIYSKWRTNVKQTWRYRHDIKRMRTYPWWTEL